MVSSFFPAWNATLNFISLVLLLVGYVLVRKKLFEAHKRVMLLAFTTSSVFLASYLYYHFNYEPNRIGATGFARNLYFFILISHIILAVVLVPLVLKLLYLAFKKQFVAHKKFAKIVFPIWVYTSATGVLIYFFLYVWFPQLPLPVDSGGLAQ